MLISEDKLEKTDTVMIEGNGNHQVLRIGKAWDTPLCRQMFILLGPLALMLCGGLALGTSTVMIPEIKSSNGTIQITPDMETWLYSVHGFATTPVVITAPFISKIKGYKFSFILICLPYIISCILQYIATSATHLLIAFILQGLTMGGNITVGVIIVSEFPDPRYRGTFLFLKGATFFWGIWIANIIGTFSTWRNIPLVGIVPALFGLLSCFTWPESPYWLAFKHKIEECKKAFRWARGRGEEAEKELAMLINSKRTERTSENMSSINFLKTTILLRQFYMPFFLNIAMFFLYHSCGKYVCLTYVLVIIKDITKNDFAAHAGMLIIDGVTVLGMYIGSYVAMKVKRRTLYFSTTASTIICLYIFSGYLYLIQLNIITQNNTVTLALLMLYSFSVSWGPMVLCTSIFSEITPLRFKPFITSTTVCFMFMMQSGFLKLAPCLFNNIGVSGTFSVYATLTVIPFLFLYKYLPETKNKTIQEIESLFIKKKNDCDDNMEGKEMLSYTDH